jgi:hypothetical protein
LRLKGGIEPAAVKVPAQRQIKPSPALSIIDKAPQTLKGRVVSGGVDHALIDALRAAAK